MKKNEQALRGPWDTLKHANICVMGAPEGETREGQKEHWKKQWSKPFQILLKEQKLTNSKWNKHRDQ